MNDMKITGRCPVCNKAYGVCACNRATLQQLQESAALQYRGLTEVLNQKRHEAGERIEPLQPTPGHDAAPDGKPWPSQLAPLAEAHAAATARIAGLEAILRDIHEEMDGRYDGAPDSRTLWMGIHLNAIAAAVSLSATPPEQQGSELEREVKSLKTQLAEARRPWQVDLAFPANTDPFNRVDCRIIDTGHADHILIVECPDVVALASDLATLREQLAEAKRNSFTAKDVDDARAGGNALYSAVVAALQPLFNEDEQGLEWDVLPSTCAWIAKQFLAEHASVATLTAEVGRLRAIVAESVRAMDALILLGEQHVPAPYRPLKERLVRDRMKALLDAALSAPPDDTAPAKEGGG